MMTPEIVVKTNYGAASDDKITAFSLYFQLSK